MIKLVVMENGAGNHPVMRGRTIELYKTWLRKDHSFVVVSPSIVPFLLVVVNGPSDGRWKDQIFFFFPPNMGTGKSRWQRTWKVLAEE